MTELRELKIYIIDKSLKKCKKLEKTFINIENVSVICDDIRKFFRQHKEIDCLVSPANSFGIMTGGYDAALSDILGWDFQKKVQRYIVDNFNGEQPVGTSFLIKTDISGVSFIHTPTMQKPSLINDDTVIYECMRSTLICATENDIKCIVIPVFGGECGGVDISVIAEKMHCAYSDLGLC